MIWPENLQNAACGYTQAIRQPTSSIMSQTDFTGVGKLPPPVMATVEINCADHGMAV